MSEDVSTENCRDKIENEVVRLQGSKLTDDGKLNQTFEFKNFILAFSFMTKVARQA